MRTTLRGFGRYKLDLILDLVTMYGRKSFTYREASTLPSFDTQQFRKLHWDGWLSCTQKAISGRPAIWQLSQPVLKKYSIHGGESHD